MNFMILFSTLWLLWATTVTGVFDLLTNNGPYGRLPEENMTAIELIRYNGYPAEIHKVQTVDGYILTMQRIPNGVKKSVKKYWKQKNPKQAVLLQHGLATTSTNWLTNLPNESLAYILADHGFDVWLGNVRGNKYSKEHVNLTRNHSKYWDFSWEEMAEYDLPSMIDYILDTTGNKRINYIGHSQGTLIGFAKFSSDVAFSEKVKIFIALAPVSTVHYITSPMRYLAPFSWVIQKTLELFGDYSLGGLTWLLDYAKPACDLVPETMLMCENLVFILAGAETKAMLNQTRIPVYLAHNPDDTSMKNIVHFGQMVNSGRMQKYDYGFVKNLAVYGQLWPPEYHPELMNVDTMIFWSPVDALTNEKDVLPLIEKLRSVRKTVMINNFSHLDFLWSMEAYNRVYKDIIHTLHS